MIDIANPNTGIGSIELVKKLQHMVLIINLVSSLSPNNYQLHNSIFIVKMES